ncbi:MAG: Gfo/Idh/MocA family protein [Burkholderiales bacterium]
MRDDKIEPITCKEKAIRVGIIGLGVMGERMARNMSAHPSLRPISGFDLNQEVSQKFAQLFPKISVHSTVESLIEEDKPDLLYIGSPPKTHSHYLRKAIDWQLPVFCEKPLGIDIIESQEATARFSQAGLFCAVNFVHSAAPAAVEAKKIFLSGSLGDIVSVEIQLSFSNWPRGWQKNASWLAERSEGGFLREVGSHFAYLTQSLLGPLSLAHPAMIQWSPSPGAEQVVLALWETGSGIPVSVTGQVGGERQDIVRWRLVGSSGSLIIDQFYQLSLETSSDIRHIVFGDRASAQTSYESQLDLLVHEFYTKRHELAGLEEALAVQKIIEQTLSSAAR